MSAKAKVQEGAVLAPTAGRFCDLVAAAARHKLPGWWSGRSFRHHPRGVVRGGIIFTNEWSTHNYCLAEVMLDPTSPIATRCQDSRASGDASCKPVRGGLLRVYSSGSWSNDDGPWRDKIVKILEDLEAEIAAADAIELEKRKREQEAREAAHLEVLAKARAAVEARP